MTAFSWVILQAIDSYKAILYKSLTSHKYAVRIRQLGIKRAYIQNADEVKLYNIGLKIIVELEQHVVITKRGESVNSYHGAEEFLQYLKKILSGYSVVNGRVVNYMQKSSRALINVIQLVDTAKEQLTDEVAQQIHYWGSIVAKHGNEEQKNIFKRAIISSQSPHLKPLFRQLRSFIS